MKGELKQRAQRFFRFHTVRFKYLVVLFLVIFLACGVTYLVMFLSMWDRMYEASQIQLQGMADFVQKVMDESGMSVDQVVDLVRPHMEQVQLYGSWDALPEWPDQLSEDKVAPGRIYAQIKSDRFFGVIQLENGYLYLSFRPDSAQANQVRWLVIRTLLISSGIASVCAAIAIRRASHPLEKLDAAFQRVARGDFEVFVEHHSKDEMGLVVKNFNAMVGELKKIEYLRKDFVSSVSHEFKTPIAAIRGSIKLLTSTPFPRLSEEKFQKYVRLILDESDRMLSLSSNLLRLSRLENQSVFDNSSTFSLDEQIRRVILLLEAQWSAKHLELDIQLDRLDYKGDEELIQQIWINLLSNAVKFTEEYGNVGVKLRRAGKNAYVEISDDGVGMDEATRDRIFEKFYQGDNSRAREGNGLGLSIVKRIVDLHDGEISFRSAPGEGTACLVLLPLTRGGITKP